MIPLLPAIVMRPNQSLPYILVYAGASMILGCVFGLVLCLSTLAVLRVLGVRFNATPA